MTKEFYHPSFEYSEYLEEGEKVFLPTTKQVCPACNGFGVHERQDIDCSKLVDSMQEDGDYEGLEGYYNGNYDVTCSTCNGRNVVDEIDFDLFVSKYPKLYAEMCDWDEQERADDAYAAQERAMGA